MTRARNITQSLATSGTFFFGWEEGFSIHVLRYRNHANECDEHGSTFVETPGDVVREKDCI